MASCSPMSAQVSAFKSPLRSFGAETVATQEIYADAHARLMQWRKDLVSSTSFEAQQALRDLQHQHDGLKELSTALADVQSTVRVAAQLPAGGARLVEVLRSSTQAAAKRVQAVACIKEEVQQSCENYRRDLQHEERSLAQQREMADAQHSEALKLLAVYKDRLGLAISREAPKTVRMTFSLLDEALPEREFFFTLGLSVSDEESNGAEMYCVNECFPHVPELAQLLEELNGDARSSMALPRFVCSMRRAFINVAKVKNSK